MKPKSHIILHITHQLPPFQPKYHNPIPKSRIPRSKEPHTLTPDEKAKKDGIFDEIKYIYNARVPVIKLEAEKKYLGKKIDITIIDDRHNGLQCAETIQEYIKKYPALRPLFLVLKQTLYLSGLNDPSKVSFNGVFRVWVRIRH